MSTNFSDSNSPDLADWISQAEAARIHGVSRQAIHKLVQSGRLKSLRVGGRVLVSRGEVESFSPLSAGRPTADESRALEKLKALISASSPEVRDELLHVLQGTFPAHPLEVRLGAPASLILEAIERSGDLTVRMIRGVIAEAAFEMYVVRNLGAWRSMPLDGNTAYDFKLEDSSGVVRVQVKLQRSTNKIPLVTSAGSRSLESGLYVVETQRTRGGTDRGSGERTRPYRFGEFDILAVSMQPSTGRWESFFYTVSEWLLPSKMDGRHLATYQPVPHSPDDDWTDRIETCIDWLRSGVKKTIRGGR